MVSVNYTVRESDRAKRVNLRLSNEGDLEIVVPRGFDRSQIPEIIAKHQVWLDRTQLKIGQKKLTRPALESRPQSLELRAIAQTWQLEYTPAKTRVIKLSEIPPSLIVWGNTEQDESCRSALKQWLLTQAQQHLSQQLKQVSQECRLPYQKVTVRSQRTRWGSCSSDKNISLNYKLLFLPPEVARYVLIHELSHTVHLNHSAQFWQLVRQLDPLYEMWEKQLKDSQRYVPGWLDL